MNRVPYASIVGILMYAIMCTRSDIVHVVGTVSRFLSNPGREHWNAVKWILRYLHGTSDLRLCFGDDEPTLVGYSNSDMVGEVDSKKSTLSYLIKFAQGVVAWQFKLQKCVALFIIKAEFIEFGFVKDKYLLLCDSQSAIHLGKNSTFYSRSKHIDIRDALDVKLLELTKIHTNDNDVDMMTKAIPRGKFEVCCEIARLTITST
ncbi:hypothetical protein CR513_08285, partial [Mucuna pruriens]